MQIEIVGLLPEGFAILPFGRGIVTARGKNPCLVAGNSR